MHSPRSADADVETRGLLLTPWSGLYDVLSFTRWRARRVLRAFPPGAGERVLDVGCGTGGLVVALARAVGTGGRVCGIDPSAAMVRSTRRKAEQAGVAVEVQAAAIERLPFETASFDRVYATLMLHHLPDDVLSAGLAEVRRVLVPGGRLHVAEFAGLAPLHRGPKVPWADTLAAAGFEAVRRVDRMFPRIELLEGRAPAER